MSIIKEDAIWALKSAMADIVMESNEYEVPGEKLETLNILNESINYDHFKKVMLSEASKEQLKNIHNNANTTGEGKSGNPSIKSVIGSSKEVAKDYFNTTKNTLKKTGNYGKDILKHTPSQLSKLPGDIKAGLMKAWKSAKTKGEKQTVLNRIKELATKGGKSIKKYAKENTIGTVAIGATIAAALTGAYYIYKRFLSQAAKSCSKLSGEKKTACMKKFKVKAAQAAIKKLQSSKRQFKGNAKKLASIDRHIASWKAKIANY